MKLGRTDLLGIRGNSYVVRVPNDGLNGASGRRWYAIANSRGLGHFKNRRNARAAIRKALNHVGDQTP